ncbi:MAG: type II toxin-antitoxin system RelE/ParE family toxin [Vulcanimicrobiaceae bacterium]
MAWQLTYYSPKVAQAVRDWPPGIRAHFLRLAAAMAEHGPSLGMPHTRAMGAGLFEVRAKGREGIGRAFYCAFIKKTEQTPVRELETARTRLREVKV